MKKTILDDARQIEKLDASNMRGSLDLLALQAAQIWQEGKGLKLPMSYKKTLKIAVLAMGGSALGADIARNLFFNDLRVPLVAVNGYHPPAWVDGNTLAIVASYSGGTEEALSAAKEAAEKGAKTVVVCSGGLLAAWAAKNRLPLLVFEAKNNPCGSPRMGLGYLIAGLILILAEAGMLKSVEAAMAEFIKTLNEGGAVFGVKKELSKNPAKRLAEEMFDKSVWLVSSGHLSGNAHAGANQINENAKRFAGYFLIPEMNHHLLEGLANPKNNGQNFLFVFFESDLYEKKIRARYEITKKILEENHISYFSYFCRANSRIGQVAEVLSLTGYASFYAALLAGIDPTPIPFVDFFKKEMKK